MPEYTAALLGRRIPIAVILPAPSQDEPDEPGEDDAQHNRDDLVGRVPPV
ncbi:MAG TPA: hypothetical protein VFC51_01965 [Chloroflexota bacterium]|nr:hypothetical protein [Chloroflexota bacterium]